MDPECSISPPPLGAVGVAEEDAEEFGAFCGGASAPSPECCVDPHPNARFVEKSQPTSTLSPGVGRVHGEVKAQHCDAEHPGLLPARRSAFTRPSGRGTAFADFSAFVEPQVYPCCCGFAPTANLQGSGGKETGLANALGEDACSDTVQQTGPRGSELRPLAQETARDGAAAQHCERRRLPTTQEDRRSRDSLARGGRLERSGSGERGEGTSGRSQDFRPPHTRGLDGVRESEGERNGVSDHNPDPNLVSDPNCVSGPNPDPDTVLDPNPVSNPSPDRDTVSESDPPTSASDSGSEDHVPRSDYSKEGGDGHETSPSEESYFREDTETNREEDDAEEEEEDFGNFRDASSCQHSIQTEATPLPFADFSQSESRTQGKRGVTDPSAFGDGDPSQAEEGVRKAGEGGWGGLPPSDSFADFCSAAVGEEGEEAAEGEGGWGAFGDQRAEPEPVAAWADFGEASADGACWTGETKRVEEEEERRQGTGETMRVAEEEERRQATGETERVAEEEERCQGNTATGRHGRQTSLLCQIQHLLQASFPMEADGEEEKEEKKKEEVAGLGALLEHHDSQLEQEEEEEEEEEEREMQVDAGHRVPRGVWQQGRNLHDAFGLRFQWGGSHSNRTLLRCLGVDTRNIIFAGQKKQPVIVPAFAANLGLLEPTKELKAASQRTNPAPAQDTAPPSNSTQGAVLSSQCAWSSGGLSDSPSDALDGMSHC